MLLAGCDWKDYLVKEQGFVVSFVGWIFSEVIPTVLYTPTILFDSNVAISILLKMSVFSAGLVTILAMIEGFKRMIAVQYTPLTQICIRYPIALGVSAFAPILFYYTGASMNLLVKYIGSLTSLSMQGTEYFTSILSSLGHHIFETFMTFFLMIILIYYSIRILLMHSSRLFGLLFNMVVTPIAMTAYMFRSFENVAAAWAKDTLGKFTVVLAHAFFLGLIAIILYAPIDQLIGNMGSHFSGAITKLLMAIGGLRMMLNPPAWITSFFEKKNDSGRTSKPFKQLAKLAVKVALKGK